ncbi:preprotein translocase subunit SecA [Vibrio sp. 947]|uniref:preprotein translocase subunit SecA n=1 Tax=unclassified Vibrio TaxID=2614977 RepID=UPI002964F7E1|nr:MULTISPECIES: preprotein translocase subunit SecA [unclassified Vibrio]MDW1582978.1 preprotein translocase subunit SecA [Vibrio sp. Vb2897]MDW1641240.1 preprotein translocase subunit SecA [Vibrio sp. Vb2896]MDW1926037.1 preprotein translocase subunit SecA [Vibrio sp. 947]
MMSNSRKDNAAVKVLKKVFGTQNDRILKKYNKKSPEIAKHYEEFKDFTDEQLLSKANELRAEFKKDGSIDAIATRTFALCQVAGENKLGMKHYDVQLIGGLILNDGNVAEMKTGEGKTLVATLPVVLRAFTGHQVHVVTVNDYLASRDAEIMRPLYECLGLSVASLNNKLGNEERRPIYACNIVYGTNSEFAFDYLRKNIAPDVSQQVQPECYFALIDEVDSILIDEARTPLIISGASDVDSQEVALMRELAEHFTTKIQEETTGSKQVEEVDADAALIPKTKSAQLTEKGYEKFEQLLLEHGVIDTVGRLYEPDKTYMVKSMETAIRAKHLYENNVDYLVSDGKIKIINSSTGRVEEGRRWSEGLHQAIEAKEGVEINPDNKTIASTSLQNFFRQYESIAGMTGTGDTEAHEFKEVYGMDVVVVPSNKPVQRQDKQDKIFMVKETKYKAILEDVIEIHKTGRPILVGTDSVQESILISNIFEKAGLKFNVLNAKNHEKEASIIAQAGERNAITVSTNMAGRGTDILLGGNCEAYIEANNIVDEEEIKQVKARFKDESEYIKSIGGLHVVGTSRNESRRVDLQLRGRSGRQGDPGSSQFYVSLDDKLMLNFGGESTRNWMRAAGFGDDDELSHPLLDRAIVKAQAKCEGLGSNMRAELLKYDDIINKQRLQMFAMRQEWLEIATKDDFNPDECVERVKGIVASAVYALVDKYLPSNNDYTWDVDSLDTFLQVEWDVKPIVSDLIDKGYGIESIKEELLQLVYARFEETLNELNMLHNARADIMLYKTVMVKTLDSYWFEQIELLDDLREGIHLRGYAQKNPLQEFGLGAIEFFKQMIESIQMDFTTTMFSSIYGSINHQKRVIEHMRQIEMQEQIENSKSEEDAKAVN